MTPCPNWQIGRDILQRQEQEGWGAKVIEQLARDLKREFPDVKGFSRTNLLYMRAFAEAYPDEQFVQQVVGQIPWGHNVRILDMVKSPYESLPEAFGKYERMDKQRQKERGSK